MEDPFGLLENIFGILVEFVIGYSFQVAGAVIILIVGVLVANWISRFVVRLCERKNVDITLRKFIADTIRILILVFVFIICLGKFGVTVAPFIAAVGAVALGASLALQGLFSNYAAGLIIILTRPFVVGNTISVKDTFGLVEEIKLAATILSTEDRERITVPNKHIMGEILSNSFAYRVVETSIGISYDDDPETAIQVILKVVSGIDEIPKEPKPQIGIQEFADSAIAIGVRYWVPTEKFYQVQFQINLSIYNALKRANITIPYPQRDVHVKSNPVTIANNA